MSKNKYEKFFQEGRGVCGAPFPEFLKFFDTYLLQQARVLDLGCGQGRDALFIARKGHHVVGVELSPTGVQQMLEDAKEEELAVDGVVADIVVYEPEGLFDVVVLDRVLHMLQEDAVKTAVLAKSAAHLKPNGFILIADEPKNQPLFHNFFDNHADKWQLQTKKKNMIFAQKIG